MDRTHGSNPLEYLRKIVRMNFSNLEDFSELFQPDLHQASGTSKSKLENELRSILSKFSTGEIKLPTPFYDIEFRLVQSPDPRDKTIGYILGVRQANSEDVMILYTSSFLEFLEKGESIFGGRFFSDPNTPLVHYTPVKDV